MGNLIKKETNKIKEKTKNTEELILSFVNKTQHVFALN
jgi:hypothetical protein